MSRIIWDRTGNPTDYVSDELGITRGQFRASLHLIKRYSNLGATDRTIIYGDGRVTDANGDDIGNIQTAMTSGISSTRSQTTEPVTAFATLRVSGDDLVPSEITKVIKIVPTKAFAKDEHYSGGQRSPDLIGRTGLWLFSTEGVVAGNNLADHLAFLARLLLPGSGEAGPLPRLRQLMRRRSLHVSVSCFWHGSADAKKPSIPRSVTDLLKLIPADVETDFDVDERPNRHAA